MKTNFSFELKCRKMKVQINFNSFKKKDLCIISMNCLKKKLTTIQDPAIRGKSWRSLDLSHNPNQASASSSSTLNSNSNALLTVTNLPSGVATLTSSHRNHYDFKNRRSSSEPVHEQTQLSSHSPTPTPSPNANNSKSGKDDSEDDVIAHKNDDYIECLQKISNIKVSEPNQKLLLASLYFSLSLSLSSLFFINDNPVEFPSIFPFLF